MLRDVEDREWMSGGDVVSACSRRQEESMLGTDRVRGRLLWYLRAAQLAGRLCPWKPLLLFGDECQDYVVLLV